MADQAAPQGGTTRILSFALNLVIWSRAKYVTPLPGSGAFWAGGRKKIAWSLIDLIDVVVDHHSHDG